MIHRNYMLVTTAPLDPKAGALPALQIRESRSIRLRCSLQKMR